MGGYSLKVRRGARVERTRFEDLDAALHVLEERGKELQQTANAQTIDPLLGRKFEPVQQVVARLELRGRGRLRAGVDVRGDGSAEAWTGRLRRKLVEQQGRETAYDALRRKVAAERP